MWMYKKQQKNGLIIQVCWKAAPSGLRNLLQETKVKILKKTSICFLLKNQRTANKNPMKC